MTPKIHDAKGAVAEKAATPGNNADATSSRPLRSIILQVSKSVFVYTSNQQEGIHVGRGIGTYS